MQFLAKFLKTNMAKIQNRVTDISLLEKKIGITFTDQDLFTHALVHRSYLNEHKDFRFTSNEKLEFLGDSVLSLVTSVYLYTKYTEYQEGDYTDMKAAIVNTTSLYEAAKGIHLGEYVYLSKGEQDNNGRDNTSILADAFEALIGVIYLQFGFDTAAEFIRKFLFDGNLDRIVEEKLYLPAKNILQEHYQEKFKKLPVYEILHEDGPEHDKTYEIGVYDGKNLLARGEGKSKKQAEESAARKALQELGI